MSDVALMQACADVAFRDVVRTTSLQLALTPWDNPTEGIGAVIHDAAVTPTHPVWEAVGYLRAGDCLALHPPHQHRAPDTWELPSPETETTTDVARVTQDVVVMLLWQRGLDATWPPCPEHPGGTRYAPANYSDPRWMASTWQGSHPTRSAFGGAPWAGPQSSSATYETTRHPPRPRAPNADRDPSTAQWEGALKPRGGRWHGSIETPPIGPAGSSQGARRGSGPHALRSTSRCPRFTREPGKRDGTTPAAGLIGVTGRPPSAGALADLAVEGRVASGSRPRPHQPD